MVRRVAVLVFLANTFLAIQTTLVNPSPDFSTPPEEYCRAIDNSWKYFEGACYFSMEKFKEWHDALDFCGQGGGQLASILSSNESAFIRDNFRHFHRSGHWIGLNALRGSAVWRWADGQPVDYLNFKPDSGVDLVQDKRCVEVDDQGYWILSHCAEARNSICKRLLVEATAPAEEEAETSRDKCPAEWTPHGEKCFRVVVVEPLSWSDAKAECSRIGAQLASIHSAQEQETLSALLEESQSSLWIGLKQPGDERRHVWTDNSRFIYSNWAARQPVYQEWPQFMKKLQCVEVKFNQSIAGAWSTQSCQEQRGYVCQKYTGSPFAKTSADFKSTSPTAPTYSFASQDSEHSSETAETRVKGHQDHPVTSNTDAWPTSVESGAPSGQPSESVTADDDSDNSGVPGGTTPGHKVTSENEIYPKGDRLAEGNGASQTSRSMTSLQVAGISVGVSFGTTAVLFAVLHVLRRKRKSTEDKQILFKNEAYSP